MSGTAWRQSTQVQKGKFTLQGFTALLRNQQRTPANPQMPSLFTPFLDLSVPLTQLP